MIDAAWLRTLCRAAGADDVAAVSLDHADLAGEREHVLAALPGTRSLIAMVFRMNRDNCRPAARSVANQEFHQTDEQVYDPADPMGKMFFNILATFAEFEVDLLRMRTREGMAVARAKGKLRGKQPKLSARQQRELARMAGTGEYTIADLAEVFTVSRATVYRTLQRVAPSPAAS